MSIGSEQNDGIRQDISVSRGAKRGAINLAVKPSDLLSKEGFALYSSGWLVVSVAAK